MSIESEPRKRLWGRSGNRCAKCRQELVRPDESDLPGALVGEEAHIIARSPGGPRYEPLPVKVRDGYNNLILLCANDHTEIDAQPSRYTVEVLREMKRQLESWVRARLSVPDDDGAQTVATVMWSGDRLWPVMQGALGWEVGMPDGLTPEDEDLIDDAVQLFTDWCEILPDVEMQGMRAMREAKRSISDELLKLLERGFLVLAGNRDATFGGGEVRGPVMVLQILRPSELADMPSPGDTTHP